MRKHKPYLLFLLITMLFTSVLPLVSAQQKKQADNNVYVKGVVVSKTGVRQHNVSGICVGADGKFIEGWTTDKRDVFKLNLEPGTYKAWAYGAKVKAITFIVPKGAMTISIKVIGKSKNAVPFKFITPNGNIAANIHLESLVRGKNTPDNPDLGKKNGIGGGRIYTDSKGKGIIVYSMFDAPFDVLFYQHGVGYAKIEINDDNELFRNTPIPVHLQSGTLVSGKVLCISNKVAFGGLKIFPVQEYNESNRVWNFWNLFFELNRNGGFVENNSVAVTSFDGDGKFTLGPLPPGKYNLEFDNFFDTNYTTETKIPINITNKKKRIWLNVNVPFKDDCTYKPSLFKGRVLNINKIPLANKEIEIDISDYFSDMTNAPEQWGYYQPVTRYVKTDAHGNFNLYPVNSTKYDSPKREFDLKWNGLSATRIVNVPFKNKRVDFVLGKNKQAN